MIVAARDLLSGGTWAGIADGWFAVVINIAGHGAPDPAARPRSTPVTRALAGDMPGARAIRTR